MILLIVFGKSSLTNSLYLCDPRQSPPPIIILEGSIISTRFINPRLKVLAALPITILEVGSELKFWKTSIAPH